MNTRIIRLCLTFLALCITPASAQTTPQERALPTSETQVKLSFAPLVKKTAPAVVNIYAKRTVAQRSSHPFAGDPFFSQFFRDDFFGGRMRKQVESALGSGVIIGVNGEVITNAHVIENADEITVVLADGREFPAKLSLKDDASDLALLRVETNGEKLPSIPLKSSETLEVGDLVLAIGNPFGVGQTVTSGIVSAQGRSSLNVNDFNFFIQTDAAINPGNSGGALVDMDGGLVGINTAIYSRDGGSLGIGFAIPSEMVASVVTAEKAGQGGKAGVIRPWLGVAAQNITADIATSLGLKTPHGSLIKALHPASPLKAAGIKVGDIVTALNDKTIRDSGEMKFRMATVPLGETAKVTIIRPANAAPSQELIVNVEAMPAPEIPPRNETTLSGEHLLYGITIANLNPAIAVELGLSLENENGVIVMNGGRILRTGDIVMEINGYKINEVNDVEKALNTSAPTQGLALTLKRGGRVQKLLVR